MSRPLALAFLVVGCLVARGWSGESPRGVRALDKKLIEYGWDVPFPDFVRANIGEMEKRPFDGVVFKLRGGGKVLTPSPWAEAKFAADLESLRNIRWKRFTDNFVIMWAASDQDWFDDAHWQAIEHNVRLVAKAARIGRCVGLCWDPEPYGANPWAYARAAHRETKSFADYEAVARRRGAQFVGAIQHELPKARILTLFQFSVLGHLLVPMKPADRAAKLSQQHYGLLPAFLNGMLETVGQPCASSTATSLPTTTPTAASTSRSTIASPSGAVCSSTPACGRSTEQGCARDRPSTSTSTSGCESARSSATT